MPTFQNMRRGSGNILAIPGKRFGAPRPNKADQPTVSSRPIYSELGFLNMSLSGVSKDSAGANLGSCNVMIFRTEDKSFVGQTTSDASGNWSVPLMKGGPFFTVAYKAGSPDVAGTTLNTLTPVQV
jgi:hypothetical protein